MANWAMRCARARRDGDRAAHGHRAHDLDGPELERRDAVGVLAVTHARARTERSPTRRKSRKASRPEKTRSESEKTLVGDGAALALGAEGVVDLRRDARGVDVERDVARRRPRRRRRPA